ncbi:MMPL family transporter [Actinopolymorpha pittospori]|uniref:RND superfamily putative drug exporter n=1 Tax=Actinopolymorpha pittospori TaxID=648752 RepID=A0A927N7W9_9ACTN|nr:MMPL family transporter [Actinopolymorpha pittospori]MBE1612638.1 RND superfamily putative drug exporter [Actinopolymorpha pittospori]
MLRAGKSTSHAPDGGAQGLSPVTDGPPHRGSLIERAVGWSAQHPVLAITGWLALIVVALLSSALISGEDAHSTDPGGAGRAQMALRAQRVYEPLRESVLVQARQPGGPRLTDDPELRAVVTQLVTTLRQVGGVTDVRSPLEPGGERLVSADARSVLVTFQLTPDDQIRAHYYAAVKVVSTLAAGHPRVRLAEAGDESLSVAVDQGIKGDFKRAEFFSFPLTVVILLTVFGSLLAAGIDVLLALTTVAGTFGLLMTIGHWVPVNSATSSLVLLIGVAVGIDYSLFYLRRFREERTKGRAVADALGVTARTSGHVVILSGLTVMLCLAGLVFTGLDNFKGLTVGTAAVVGLAMVGSVSVLPAILALLGRRVDAGRIPWLGRRRASAVRSRTWAAVAGAVVRRPLLWGGLATLALVLAALPALGMRLQDAAPTNSLTRSVPTVDAAIRMQEAFPGAAMPAHVVIWSDQGGQVDGPAVRKAIDELRGRVATDADGLAEPIAVVPVDRVLVLRVPLAGSGTDATSNQALETLRNVVLPATIGQVAGVDYAVSGRTAFAYDFANTVASRTPIVFAFVLVLAFVLLVVTFRSLAIPMVSILLNLLSVGAAYGVLTWIFQEGHLASLLGFSAYGGVVSWLPLFMFVLLFGLSMDYHIFILSRVRERWSCGAADRAAIVDGIACSAGVVTSAAVIMTAVFSVFVTLSAIEYKMLGVGMAVAILIDATVIRGVLLPAALALLGVRAWALPRWLRWQPGAPSRRAERHW